jgi:hypothetical protein
MINFKIRNFEKKDFIDIYKWENDYLALANSFGKKNFSYGNHYLWCYDKLRSNNFSIFILYDKNKKFGLVKIKKYKNTGIISINLNPKFRGKKLSTKFLLKSEKELPKKIKILRAYVFKSNNKSVKMFTKCDYQKIKFIDNKIKFEKKINNGLQ